MLQQWRICITDTDALSQQNQCSIHTSFSTNDVWPYDWSGNCDDDGDGVINFDEIAGCQDDTACNYDANATDDDGSCSYPEANFDCDGNCTVTIDCAGVCGGSAVEDECGVCNGDGIADGACDCDGNVADCAGTCGGSAVEDECGDCGGSGPAENFTCDGFKPETKDALQAAVDMWVDDNATALTITVRLIHGIHH